MPNFKNSQNPEFFETRTNSLNFSFKPNFEENLNTKPSMSEFNNDSFSESSKENPKDLTKTSIFESALMSSFRLEPKDLSKSPPKLSEPEPSQPDPVFSFSQGLSINFNVLN